MKIILSGGGTLGPVVPLLAIADVYRQRDKDVKFVWLGTKNGPERALVEQRGIRFIPISSGKLRRYFSIRNFFDLFILGFAFFQSIYILWREKPNLLISVGGYVSVPVHWAAGFLAMPTWVHQQDVDIGLANKLMFGFTTKITTALADTFKGVKKFRVEWIGNPSRNLSVKNSSLSRKKFDIPEGAPVIFVLGGGTGSTSINELILAAVPQLDPKWYVIHLLGKNRPSELATRASAVFTNYKVYSFFTEEMKDAYAIADVVVSRAGFSTLSELASLSKAAIILPMFGTHQENNAKYFSDRGGVVLLDSTENDGLKAAQIIKNLILTPKKRADLGKKLHELLPQTKPEKIIEIITSLTKI